MKILYFAWIRRSLKVSEETINPPKNIKNVIQDFEQLGWVDQLTQKGENDFSFVIKESIHRFQMMYEYEISNFEEFVNNLTETDNE